MFRIQLNAGPRQIMILDRKRNLIHYFNEVDGLLAIIGPLQPEEASLEPEGEEHE